MKKFRVGSCFSGIGALCGGFEDEGFEIAWQIEIDDAARGVLDRLYPKVPKFRDIRDVGAKCLSPVDVIVGGWPCTDLSVAGARAGLQGGKTRSGLFFEMMRVIEELRPEWVVFENVPGLLSQKEQGGDNGRCLCGWDHGWRGLLDDRSQQEDDGVRLPRLLGDDGRRDAGLAAIPQAIRGDAPSISDGDGEVGGGVGVVPRGEGASSLSPHGTAAPYIEEGSSSDADRTGGDEDPASRAEEVNLESLAAKEGNRAASDRDGSQSQGAGEVAAGRRVARLGVCEGCGRRLSKATNPRSHRRYAMGAVLGAFSRIGYVGTWRVVDAQEFAVPQRRTRVFGAFTHGHLGAERAAEVLAFTESLSGNPPKGRKTRAGVAAPLTSGTPGSGPGCGEDAASGHLVAFGRNNTSGPDGTTGALMGQCGGRGDFETETFIIQCHGSNVGPMGTLRRGSGNHTSGVPIVVNALTSSGGGVDDSDAQAGHLIVFGCKDSDPKTTDDGVAPTLRSMRGDHANGGGQVAVVTPEHVVRRLTPVECERLQGWADGTTAIKIKNGVAVEQADAPRYKQIGNGVVRPVARYVARRLMRVMNSPELFEEPKG